MSDAKIKKIIRAELNPKPEFVEKNRSVFVSALITKIPETIWPTRTWPIFVRGLVAGIALMALVGGASAFADTQDVQPNNILYPLKRSFEQISMMMATGPAQAPLYAKLAERRLNEIKTIKARDPKSGAIAGLATELRNDFKKSLDADGDSDVTESGPEDNAVLSAAPIGLATATFAAPSVPYPAPKNKNTGKKDPVVCSQLQKIIESDEPEVNVALSETEDLNSRFFLNCQGGFNPLELGN